MQSVGERLEEARKRKGISLREAAEGTKIRSDFLANIEQNKFDFELPEIYKRGFLKNYARFLKLNPEKLLVDYTAQQAGPLARGAKRGGSEWFGQLEIKHSGKQKRLNSDVRSLEKDDSQGDGSVKSDGSAMGSVSAYGQMRPRSESTGAGQLAGSPKTDERRADEEEEESDKIFYIKAGLVTLGAVALIFVIFGLVKAILGSGGSDEESLARATPACESSARATVAQPGAPDVPEATLRTFTLSASGTVYVLVKQKLDNSEIFRRTLEAGDTVTLEKEGPVDVLFTAGENLEIEHAGERLRPSSSGTAKISLP